MECSGCGRKFSELYDTSERAARDLPGSAFTATVFIEIYRVKCPDCGVKREKVPLLPGKAPFPPSMNPPAHVFDGRMLT